MADRLRELQKNRSKLGTELNDSSLTSVTSADRRQPNLLDVSSNDGLESQSVVASYKEDENDARGKEGASMKMKSSGDQISNKSPNALATRDFDDEMDLTRGMNLSESVNNEPEKSNAHNVNIYENGQSVDSVLVKEMNAELFSNNAEQNTEVDADGNPTAENTAKKRQKSFKATLLHFLRRIQVNIGLIWLGYVTLVCVLILLVSNEAIYNKIHSSFEVFVLMLNLDLKENFEDALAVISSTAEEVAVAFSSGISNSTNSDEVSNFLYQTVAMTSVSGIIFQLLNGTLDGISRTEANYTQEYSYLRGTSASILSRIISQDSASVAIDNSKPTTQISLPSMAPCLSVLNQSNYDNFKGSWSNFHPWRDGFGRSFCFPVYSDSSPIGLVQAPVILNAFQNAVALSVENFLAYKDVQVIAFSLDGRYLGSTLNLTINTCPQENCIDSDSIMLTNLTGNEFISNLIEVGLKRGLNSSTDDLTAGIADAVATYQNNYAGLTREQDTIRRIGQWSDINGERFISSIEILRLSVPGGMTVCVAVYIPTTSIYVVSDLQLLVNIAIAAVLLFFAAITSVPVLRSVKEPISSVTEFLSQFFTRFNYVPPEIGPVERYMHFVTQELGEEGTAVRKMHRYPLSQLVEMRKMQVGVLRIYRCFTVLERFLPKELCQRITECRPGSDSLSASEETVAVLYIHIDRFYEIVESLSGERLGMMFTSYLEKIIRVIQKRQAVVTELEGHCILCHFKENDPSDSCMKAILCAIEVKKCATALRARMKARGLPVLIPNCVVHYGKLILGNIGTPQQLKYITFGQSITIAKALTPVTKVLGIKVLVTEGAMEYALQTGAILHSRALLKVNMNEVWPGIGDIVIHETLVETSPQEIERVQEYRMVYQEYYDSPAEGKDAEDIFNYERLCDSFVKKHGVDGPTAFLKKRLRGMGKAVPLSHVLSA